MAKLGETMVWDIRTSNGNEAAKIRYEVLPYVAAGGLDVGCGPSKVWPHLIGIDSEKDTALFGVPMKPDIVVPDAARLSIFADGSADSVFSSHLLEHIADWQAALREWWRLVKVGGHLVLYLPHADLYPRIGQPGANPDHKHDFTPDDIVDFMRLAFADWSLLQNQVRGEGAEYSFLLVLRKEAAGHGQAHPHAAPRAEKTAGLVRVGGNGDALWAGSVAAHLHAQGYAVTAYVAKNGEEVLRHDPHIARIVVMPTGLLNDDEMLEFWAHEGPKYDRWVNLIGSVEGRLLPHQSVHEFYLPQGVRHQLMDRNYLDMVHAYAELPAGTPSRQKFYPTEAEIEWARKMRAEIAGPFVLLSPTGSGPFKAWPHAQRFMELMADAGIATVMVGDLQDLPDLDIVTRHGTDYGHVVGQEWPLRLAMTMALQADAVVATESVFANAVAMEAMPKVVMLSHSSHENLTRDWVNTAALEAPVACHPCHRIHNRAAAMCSRDTITGKSACMASYSADAVADLVLKALRVEQKAAA
ncbi:MAG: methyltransferase domain-containing protein [Gammaproteobacteria bacterium]|nr:methyltransferase domain-containing protein [Gammaproteobacteria bacterium]MBU1647426.1 methyltransferase domain-containing protein [Gammaproteobacteria bacterium]MBU1973218.1 methyltransferase domain-containing protein [Gammaproteobacteria bacterium]